MIRSFEALYFLSPARPKTTPLRYAGGGGGRPLVIYPPNTGVGKIMSLFTFFCPQILASRKLFTFFRPQKSTRRGLFTFSCPQILASRKLFTFSCPQILASGKLFTFSRPHRLTRRKLFTFFCPLEINQKETIRLFLSSDYPEGSYLFFTVLVD